MGESTGITWTDHTFNPWWGCTKVSPGCTNCYAEEVDARFGMTGGGHWGNGAGRRFFGQAHWNEPVRWNTAAQRDGVQRRVFCASMADVFEDRRDLDGPRDRLWRLIRQTPHLTWQLLTKRPENVAKRFGSSILTDNVWLGVTAENQESWDERVPILRDLPARVRFVSYEPALGELGLRDDDLAGIHWVIAGDESGRKRRPAQLDWIRKVRDACARSGIAFHFKQWCGDDAPGLRGTRVAGKIHLPILDDAQHGAFP